MDKHNQKKNRQELRDQALKDMAGEEEDTQAGEDGEQDGASGYESDEKDADTQDMEGREEEGKRPPEFSVALDEDGNAVLTAEDCDTKAAEEIVKAIRREGAVLVCRLGRKK